MSSIEPISGHNDRIELKTVLPLATPFTLNIFPTNSCNFRCNYCAQSLGAEGLKKEYGFKVSDKMSLETFKKIVEQSRQFEKPYKLLSFMGHGEPLLNKDISEMICMAKSARLAERIEIITNASLLTPELSDKLTDAGITNLRVSLQGLTVEKYKTTSNASIDFDKFLENLKYFHEKGKETGACLYVKILDCALEKSEVDLFYKTFDNISSKMYIEKVKPVYTGVKSTENLDNLTTDRYGNNHTPRIVCPLAFFSLAIWPNGDIAPCDAIYKPVTLGNVHTESLVDVFTGRANNEFRLELLRGNKNNMYGCNSCCAPDDVSHEKDILDDDAVELIKEYLQ